MPGPFSFGCEFFASQNVVYHILPEFNKLALCGAKGLGGWHAFARVGGTGVHKNPPGHVCPDCVKALDKLFSQEATSDHTRD